MLANTCIEATGRLGMELGYHITIIKDAIAAFSHEGMHAALEVNGPQFAHAILTTNESAESVACRTEIKIFFCLLCRIP